MAADMLPNGNATSRSQIEGEIAEIQANCAECEHPSLLKPDRCEQGCEYGQELLIRFSILHRTNQEKE